MKNYIQPGMTVPLTAPAAISSGDGVLVGSLLGIAASDAASGASVEVQVEGVFEIPKAADDITQGDALYWDDSAKNMTTASSGNTEVGKAIRAAGTGASVVLVRLNGWAWAPLHAVASSGMCPSHSPPPSSLGRKAFKTGDHLSNRSPQTNAKNTAAALLQAARDAGRARPKFEIKPDGSITLDAGMHEGEDDDDFLSADLRMSK